MLRSVSRLNDYNHNKNNNSDNNNNNNNSDNNNNNNNNNNKYIFSFRFIPSRKIFSLLSFGEGLSPSLRPVVPNVGP